MRPRLAGTTGSGPRQERAVRIAPYDHTPEPFTCLLEGAKKLLGAFRFGFHFSGVEVRNHFQTKILRPPQAPGGQGSNHVFISLAAKLALAQLLNGDGRRPQVFGGVAEFV